MTKIEECSAYREIIAIIVVFAQSSLLHIKRISAPIAQTAQKLHGRERKNWGN
jgi:hypothetical protein